LIGFNSPWKRAEREVMQEDPLSIFLFILQLITLGDLLRRLSEENGIKLTLEQVVEICAFFATRRNSRVTTVVLLLSECMAHKFT
jgi:hypothetical protein